MSTETNGATMSTETPSAAPPLCLVPADVPPLLRLPGTASLAAFRVSPISLYLRTALSSALSLTPDRLATLTPAVREHLVRVGARFILSCDRLSKLFEIPTHEINKKLAAAQEKQRKAEQARLAALNNMIYIGSREVPENYATIGWRWNDGRPVALSQKGGQLILAVGNLGSGKSQTSTALCESLLGPIPNLTSDDILPTAPISFTYVPDGLRLPDVLAGLFPNDDPDDAEFLQERLAVSPQPIERMRLVMPEWLLKDHEPALRPLRDRGLRVIPLRFRLSQMALSGIEMLLGGDPASSYMQVMLEAAEGLGSNLRIDDWRQVLLKTPDLDAVQRRRALSRLSLLSKVASEDHDLWDMVKPGDYTVFALGGKWIRDSEAMPLIMSLMNALTQPSDKWGAFQRFFLTDEFNRYAHDPLVKLHLLTAARQIRHRGACLMLCGQDLRGLHDELVALSTTLMVFRLESPAVWNDIKERRGGLSGWRFEDVRALFPGQALVVVSECTERELERRAQCMYFRPTLCQHGGFTKSMG